MLRTVALAVAFACAPVAHAAKCRSGNSVLYTQDDYCPSGYTDITSSGGGGTVSSIGKSDLTKQQEADYLRRRNADHQAEQKQVAVERQQLVAAENSRRYDCNGLFVQRRNAELAMRQGNAWQSMEALRQQYRAIQEGLARLGC
ncbi:hypothetical protein [Cupriavidus numazuensis]|uniref:DUF4124 domain-containing protein n=1 Tax=Cupriavidus numazuensis TaxID=221992 RepID=A0ABN7Q303_9BURK|nr:hypothetical protein LMG26411_02828 [Cupriavidus numazuensis]